MKQHKHYTIKTDTFPLGGGYLGCRAICTCGWRSERLSTGGLAGSAWDQHVEQEASNS